eukprot:COSAG06_NODE_35444_length_460_cov_0.645429_1_plen_126_part_01
MDRRLCSPPPHGLSINASVSNLIAAAAACATIVEPCWARAIGDTTGLDWHWRCILKARCCHMLYGTILRSLRTMPATTRSSCISSKALHVSVVLCLLPILVKTTRRLTVLYLSVHIHHTQVAYGAM